MAVGTRPQSGARRRRGSVLKGLLSLALLAGMALEVGLTNATAGASTSGKSTLEVCKSGSVSGSFQFKSSVLNGGMPFSVAAGSCVSFSVSAGKYTVRELPDPTGQTTLKAIEVVPTIDLVSSSISNRNVTVQVPGGSDVSLQFVNQPASGKLKVCKVAGDPSLVGRVFSFTEQAGGKPTAAFNVVAGLKSPLSCGPLTSYKVGTTVNIAEIATPNIVTSSITVTGGTRARQASVQERSR